MATLEEYVRLLEKWNKSINLVAKSTLEAVWERHIADSAQLFSEVPSTTKSLADLGSGGGLPGMVLAIIANEAMPDMSVTLVESDARKCAFLTTAATKLGLGVKVKNERIEQLDPLGADVITARALTSLDRLLEFAQRHGKEAGQCLFLKGQDHRKEIVDARKIWCFDMDIIPSTTNPDAAVLRVENIRPR